MPYGRPQDYPRGHPERERYEAQLTGDYDFPEGAEGSEAEMAASMMMERGGGLGQFTPSGPSPVDTRGLPRERIPLGPHPTLDQFMDRRSSIEDDFRYAAGDYYDWYTDTSPQNPMSSGNISTFPGTWEDFNYPESYDQSIPKRRRKQFGPRLNVDPRYSPQRNNRDRFFRTSPLYSDEIESLPEEIRRFLML